MRERDSRRTPERIAIGWTPFMLGAAVAVFAGDSKALLFANLLAGLAFAVLLASSTRSTGRLIRLLPRLGALVLAVNAAVLIVLFALDRI